jgi:tRNA-uridine 2-sulfurtransferase
MSNSKLNVTVGMSGGVDSAVAAYLLKNQGYTVSALFMQNWDTEQDDPYCNLPADLEDAKTICKQLDIPLSIVNFSKEYWQSVFQHFLDEYACGRTPNPDILCNKEIKFKAFLNYALANGADLIATGHYARIKNFAGKYQLQKSLDKNKDQSYFLYTLNQHQLAKSLFPLGHLTKTETRDIAKKIGLSIYNKKDSTGICFIGERNFKRFLEEYLLGQPGEIVTNNNRVIGKHDGLMFYTLGQRKGLHIGGIANTPEKPWYVIEKDLKHNKLIVSQDSHHPMLFSTKLTFKEASWSSGNPPPFPLNCSAKIRYRQDDQICTIFNDHSVEFASPQRAITPGQAVVFYQGDICLGGGTILKSSPDL